MGCGASKAVTSTSAPVTAEVPAAVPVARPADYIEGDVETTYAMIKPGYEHNWSHVFNRIADEGLEIIEVKTFQMDQDFAEKFYAEHVGKDFFPKLSGYMTSGTVVGLKLRGPAAVANWRRIIGPTNLEKAKAEAPTSLRALYARDGTENLCHGSDAVSSAEREIGLVFGNPEYKRIPNSGAENTYAMVKPNYDNKLGAVLERINKEGLKVVNLLSFKMDQSFAEKFYAEHVGKDFFPVLSGYMTSGTVYGLELEGPNAVAKWREMLGPTNLDKAKAEAPESLRALHARSTTQNFCHGSDSKDSADRETALVFGH